jgi:hypothetical protein
MCVAPVGYSTGVIARCGNQSADVIIDAVILSAVGLTHTLLWHYAGSRRLLPPDLDPDLFGCIRNRGLCPTVLS